MARAYDAIVIGAGVNGLAAAVHLGSKGWKVAVVERNASPGGAVKTAEVTLPGFRHDLYATNLGLFAGSPFLAAHRDLLTKCGLAFVTADKAFASVFEDGSWLGVERDLEATARRIGVESPADERRWRALAARFPDDAPHLFALLGSPLPSLQAVRALWRAWRDEGTGFLAETARLFLSSPRGWLDAGFDSPKLKAMMAVWGMHVDFAPDIAGGAMFPYLESMVDQQNGMVLGRGGADIVVKAMIAAIEAQGGSLMTEADVNRIAVDRGRATGIHLTDGRRLSARRAIVANVHPRLLFGRLVAGGLDDRRAAAAAALRPGPATMMIHLAVSDLPDWPDPSLRTFPYVHVAPDLGYMARAYTQAMDGLLPADPVQVVGQPTAADPTRAPEGQHVLWIQVRPLPRHIKGDAGGTIRHADWGVVKESYADRVIARIERCAPGLREKVLGRHLVSPADLEEDNPNLVEGDSAGASHHLDQNFLFRPAFGMSRYKTHVEGLYIVGAATWPGAGTGAGSGYLCARMLAGA